VPLSFILLLPAALILKIGVDLARTRIVLGNAGLDLTVNRFRIWGLRPLASAELRWSDVQGVQEYDIPNPMAPGGTQIDYVVHTSRGAFAVSSVQFRDAAEIARAIAAGAGRNIGELAPSVVPVGATRRADHLGQRLMRLLGWIALALGGVLPLLVGAMWASGKPLPPNTIGGLAAASATLLVVGRTLRRFELK